MPRQIGPELYVKISADLTGFLRDMKKLSGKIQKVGRDFERVGSQLTRTFTLPLLSAGLAGGKMAMDFEESLSRITGLVGVAKDEVAAMGREILELAPRVGKGPKELADALFFITSAGLRGRAAMDTLKASAQAAAAGLGETQSVADAVTSALNAYGQENLSAARATSILVATVREGKAEASAIAPVLGRIIPIASEMGVTFDQVGAALAAMTRLGLDASESATALRGVLMALQKPTAEAEKTLSAFGLSAAGLRRQLREEGLLPVLMTLRERFADNEDALNKVVPNVRALAGMLALVGQNAAQTEQIFASLAGTTEKDLDNAFAASAETARFKFNAAIAAVQSALINLGQNILPSVVPWVERLGRVVADLSNAWSRLSEEERQSRLAVLALAAAAGPALSAVSMLTSSIAALLSPVGLAVAGLGLLATVIISVRQEMTRAAREAARYGQEVADAARKALESEREARLEAVRATHAEEIRVHRDRIRLAQEEADAKRRAAEEAYEAAKKANAQALDDARRTYDQKRKLLDAEYLAKLKNLDGMTAAAIAFLQSEIDAIDEAIRAEERARRDAEDAARMASLRALLAAEEDADARAKIAEQIADLELSIQRRKLAESRDDQKRALRAEIDQWRNFAEQQREILREQQAAEKQALDEGLAATTARLENEAALLDEAYTAELKRLGDSLAAFVAVEQEKTAALQNELDKRLAAINAHYDLVIDAARRADYYGRGSWRTGEFDPVWEPGRVLPPSPEAVGRAAEQAELQRLLRLQAAEAAQRQAELERARALEMQQSDRPVRRPGRLPGLAGGGRITGPGWAVVGERGPEVVHLPRGASVIPLDQSRHVGPVMVYITINEATDAHAVGRQVEERLDRVFSRLALEGVR